MARDMTRGPIARTLAAFSVPLILGGLLQQLYNWVDALIVGNVVGESSLAAIGATGSLSGLFVSLLMGFAVGISVLAAQHYGAGERERVGPIASAFLAFLCALSALLAVAGIALARPLLALLRTPQEILAASASYLSITLIGLPAMAAYNVYTAILRGIGDSRTPLIAIAVSAVANAALDLWFVAGLRWGVEGAAAATVLSQVAMTAFLLIYARRKYPMLRGRRGRRRIRGRWRGDDRVSDAAPVDARRSADLRRGLALSLPTAIQASVRSLGGLLLQNIMNAFGATVVAAITTAYRIDSVVLLPVSNLGAGVSTFAAQNHGAGNARRARRGMRAGIALGVAVAVAVTAIVIPSGGALMRLFGVTDEAATIGQRFFGVLAPFYPLFALGGALNGYLQGRGDVAWCGAFGIASLAVRIGLSYAMAADVGAMTIAWAEVASWGVQLAMLGARYAALRGRDRREKALAADGEGGPRGGCGVYIDEDG